MSGWSYHRQHGSMTDILPMRVDAVLRLVCTGGERSHGPVLLGELVRTREGWTLGRGPHLVLRVYGTDGEIMRDQTAERAMRDGLLADLAETPGVTADTVRYLPSTRHSDSADTARAHWGELADVLHKVAVEARCPADGCRLHRKAQNVLAAGDKLDFEIWKDNPVQRARQVPEQYALNDFFGPIWEMNVSRLTHF